MQQAIDQGSTRLRDLKLSPVARSVVTVALTLFKQREPADTLDSIEGLRRDLAVIDDVLKDIYDNGLHAEMAEAQAAPFGEAWMASLRRRLALTANQNRPDEWVAEWLDTWGDALASARWNLCAEIAAITGAPVDVHSIRTNLAAVVTPLEAAQPASSLPALNEVLADPRIPVKTATRLRVLKSRILRQVVGDAVGAAQAAAEATQLSSSADPPTRLLALAAQVEADLGSNQLAEAQARLDGAFDSEAAIPDLFIAAGRLAAANRQFRRANEFYDAAALRFGPEAAEPQLLREVPGNLLWRTARQVSTTDTQAALELIDRALTAGIEGSGPAPERSALQEKARLLEKLGHTDEAAAAYRAAADRYEDAGSDRALRLYQKACALAPGNARYHWAYGEALRGRATDANRVVDVTVLDEAIAQLDRGFALAQPDREDAWALASAALAANELGTGPDPSVLIERAILLDPDYVRGYGFLSFLLREKGFVTEAAAAAKEGYELPYSDSFLLQMYVYTLADMGSYREALNILDLHPPTPDFAWQKVSLHLRLGEPENALAAVDDVDIDEEAAQFVRGICYQASGDEDQERHCFEAVWNARTTSKVKGYAAWAAYRIGLLDESARLLMDMIENGSKNQTNDLDLAQVRLVRGSQASDDLAEGATLLFSAIDKITIVDHLIHMATIEFPLARRAVRGHRHETAVCSILDEASERVARRCDYLRTVRRPQGDAGVRLAHGRESLSRKDFGEALQAYLGLVQAGDSPETQAGLKAAAQGIIAYGDSQLATAGLQAAYDSWHKLIPATGLLGTGEMLTQALHARLGLTALELKGPSDDEAVKLLSYCDERSISEALQHFARDIPTFWEHRDGLRVMAEHNEIRPPQRATLIECAENIPFDRVYSLGRDAVSDHAVFPLVYAIELALCYERAQLMDSPVLGDGIPALRERLVRENGVRIPAVRGYLDSSLPPDTARFLVYEQAVADVAIPAAATNPAEIILSRFTEAISENLFRLISVDEVGLWAAGWDASAPTVLDAEPAWATPDGTARSRAAERLRLARLLRMLLREGIPINDRDRIIDGFRAAEEGGAAGPAETLAKVRPLLFPAILGPEPPPQIWPVPADLEARMLKGLSPDSPSVWELPRAAAVELVSDMRNWRSQELPPTSVTLSVSDARVRPFLWRLLAADRPPIFVVAREELP
jgi:tetratricopeptide (TPR) repeat protein